MSTDDVLLLRWGAHFLYRWSMWYNTFNSSAERGESIRDTYSLTRTRRKYLITLPLNRTRRRYQRRRRSTYGVLLLRRGLLMKVYNVLYFIISRTRRRYQRRRERADGVLLLRRGLLDEVYDALYFIISRTQRRYQRLREKADGVLLLRRDLLDEVYDALYAFCPSLD